MKEKTVITEINDKRNKKEFTGISFSKFKKTEVKKQLMKSILDGKVEPSNYWCCELICAGHFLDVWEIILTIMSKYIHYGNPKIPIYLNVRFENFKEILINGYLGNELKLRNNSKIRILFAEIISILCFSHKKHSYDVIKIKNEDFNMTEINFRLKADNLHYVEHVFQKDDPKELFIACNELAYCLTNKQRLSNEACYWIEWISEYETVCKKKKEICICERRSNIPVDIKKQKDIIWIIWDILLHEATKRETIVVRVIKSLLNLFCLHYTNGVKKRRRFILYFAVSILTEQINYSIKINEKTELVNKIIEKIDSIYKQVKKNEYTPDTEYLFHGLKENNFEKTMSKIDKMNNFSFIPRK